LPDITFRGVIINQQPRIPVLFEIPAYNISGTIPFVIDTGSRFSALSEKDATILGIDCASLPYAKTEAVGFGGTFRTKMINRLVNLTFHSADTNEEYKIRYSSGFKVIVIPQETPREEREKMLRYTPSVLGMDILKRFELQLDRRRVQLILRK